MRFTRAAFLAAFSDGGFAAALTSFAAARAFRRAFLSSSSALRTAISSSSSESAEKGCRRFVEFSHTRNFN